VKLRPAGRSGVELVHITMECYPPLPVIFTNGYIVLFAQDPSHGFEMPRRPYSFSQLAQALSEFCKNEYGGQSPAFSGNNSLTPSPPQ